MVSQATRALGSLSRNASRIRSEIRSASLSGWPSETDSEENRPLRIDIYIPSLADFDEVSGPAIWIKSPPPRTRNGGQPWQSAQQYQFRRKVITVRKRSGGDSVWP